MSNETFSFHEVSSLIFIDFEICKLISFGLINFLFSINTGLVLEYKINLDTKVEALDYVTNKSILKQDFNSSLNYKIQSRYSDSLTLEGKTIDDLIEQTYQNILFNLSKNIISK